MFEMPEMYVQMPDGKRVKIGNIQSAEISSDYEYNIWDDYRSFASPVTATFEVTWNPNAETIYVLIHGKLPSNNWRKMHGLGTRRKCSRRRKR